MQFLLRPNISTKNGEPLSVAGSLSYSRLREIVLEKLKKWVMILGDLGFIVLMQEVLQLQLIFLVNPSICLNNVDTGSPR